MIGSPRLAVRDYVIDTMLCFFLFTKCVCVCVCVYKCNFSFFGRYPGVQDLV